jgi:hypothetical protein
MDLLMTLVPRLAQSVKFGKFPEEIFMIFGNAKTALVFLIIAQDVCLATRIKQSVSSVLKGKSVNGEHATTAEIRNSWSTTVLRTLLTIIAIIARTISMNATNAHINGFGSLKNLCVLIVERLIS